MSRQKTVKLNISKCLKAKKMTLKDLQRKTEIDYSSLHDHAHGRAKRIDLLTLAKLRKALRCSWDDLLRLE